MPFVEHIRITALGVLGNSAERFSYGFNLASSGATIPLVSGNQELWDDIAQDVRNFHISPGALIQPYARLTEVKFALIGTDGLYLEDSYTSVITPANGSATGSPFVLPQNAMAVSLDTTRRGPTGKGRFYVPMFTGNINGDSLLCDATQAQGLANAAATLLTAVNNQPGIDQSPNLAVSVVSSKGYSTPVTSVRVGRVIDTIRSRRRQLVESYGADVTVS